MRIGELAATLGVSARMIRHYHRRGLLPEPPRRVNGYRDYRLSDAVRLARIRTLAGLGLGLDEVRRLLGDGAGGELPTLLRELDADLARQERAIRQRRGRLAALLRRDVTDADDAAPAELADVLAVLHDGYGPATAASELERGLVTLAGQSAQPQRLVLDSLEQLAGDTAAAAEIGAVYRELDLLPDRDADAGRVHQLARRLAAASAASFPPELLASLHQGHDPEDLLDGAGLSPTQRAVFGQSLLYLLELSPADPGSETGARDS